MYSIIMEIIIFTSPDDIADEATIINELFHLGLDELVIRKPHWKEEDFSIFLDEIDGDYYPLISICDHPKLVINSEFKGLHCSNSFYDSLTKNEQHILHNQLAKNGKQISISAHHPGEWNRRKNHFDQIYLCPIYPSISKPGYSGDWDLEAIKEELKKDRTTKVIALGGVDANKIFELDALGFDGVGLLGIIWNKPKKAIKNFLFIEEEVGFLDMEAGPKPVVSRFHYLTQDLKEVDHLELIREACHDSSVSWIQLRVKNKSKDEIFCIAEDAMDICLLSSVKLIINDHVDIADEVGADGVHLGSNDMSVAEARKILGDDRIIGGTANTIEDIERLVKEGADYIGVGPFRFTETKQNLSPVLGIEGYKKIMRYCHKAKIDVPIIAIGGIQIDDVEALMDTGIYGIAVSSAINKYENRAEEIDNFLTEMDEALIIRN
jgi:thiamine-phosphate pyrophosphorylase